MQHRAAIAQAGNTLAIQQVRINAGYLRRAVGPQAQHAPGELIHEFEGLQAKCLTGTGEQRLQMLQQGRHDQLVAIATRHVQQVPTKFFDVPCFGRQDIGNVIRQDPSRHVNFGGAVKNVILPGLDAGFCSQQKPNQQRTSRYAAHSEKSELAIIQLKNLCKHPAPASRGNKREKALDQQNEGHGQPDSIAVHVAYI
jgi:hypothetical protein